MDELLARRGVHLPASGYRGTRAGDGERIVVAHETEFRKRRRLLYGAVGFVVLAALGYGLAMARAPVATGVVCVAVVGAAAYHLRARDETAPVPELVEEHVGIDRAADEYGIDPDAVSAATE